MSEFLPGPDIEIGLPSIFASQNSQLGPVGGTYLLAGVESSSLASGLSATMNATANSTTMATLSATLSASQGGNILLGCKTWFGLLLEPKKTWRLLRAHRIAVKHLQQRR